MIFYIPRGHQKAQWHIKSVIMSGVAYHSLYGEEQIEVLLAKKCKAR